jgi:hypothetical protein
VLYCTGVLGRWEVNGNSCLAPLVELNSEQAGLVVLFPLMM